MKVWFLVGTEDINPVLDCQLLDLSSEDESLDVRGILLHLCWLVLFERVTSRLPVRRSARQTVKQHRGLELN